MYFWQYFLNPKIAVEPVPPQLELIVEEIIVPFLTVFHNIVDKVDIFNFLSLLLHIRWFLYTEILAILNYMMHNIG